MRNPKVRGKINSILAVTVRNARSVEAAGIYLLDFNVNIPYSGVTIEWAADRIREQVAAVCRAACIPGRVKIKGQSSQVAALSQAARDAHVFAVIMIDRLIVMLRDLDAIDPALASTSPTAVRSCFRLFATGFPPAASASARTLR